MIQCHTLLFGFRESRCLCWCWRNHPQEWGNTTGVRYFIQSRKKRTYSIVWYSAPSFVTHESPSNKAYEAASPKYVVVILSSFNRRFGPWFFISVWCQYCLPWSEYGQNPLASQPSTFEASLRPLVTVTAFGNWSSSKPSYRGDGEIFGLDGSRTTSPSHWNGGSFHSVRRSKIQG